MTAIVGSSGSGKSTIASLIPRLYDFESGSLSIDDFDIRSMHLQQLRSLTAVVAQSTSLLQGSIIENVAVGLLSSPKHAHLHEAILDGRLRVVVEAVQGGQDFKSAIRSDVNVQEIVHCVQEAIDLAEASMFVDRLQHGLASDAGHNGRQLSGGQVQRLGIARALIKDAPILILDEATASLDSMTERDIQATIERNCAGKTIICIAHRLSTIKNADKVIVLDHGRIIEEGAYAELLDRDGPFARMVQQQDMGGHSRASTLMSSSSLPLIASKVDDALTQLELPATDLLIEHPLETTPLLGSTVPTAAAKTEPEASVIVQLFPRVLALALSQRKYLILGAISAILAGTSAIINAVAFGNMVGAMSPCNGWNQVLSSGRLFGVAFLTLAVYDSVTTTFRGASLGKFSHRVLLNARILTFRSLFSQDIAWHEDSGRNPNMLLSYLTNDANSLGAMSGALIGVCLSIIVNLLLGILVSHIIAWKIAIVLLSLMPLLLASGFLRIRMMARFSEKHREAFANSVGVAKDAIDHIQTVALYSLEGHVEGTYQRSLQEPYKQTFQLTLVGNFWLALSFGLGSLVYALAYWWGAYQVQQGQYSTTQFFIVLPALLVSAQQCGQLFTLAPDISRAGVAAKEIFKQIDLGPLTSGEREAMGACDLESAPAAAVGRSQASRTAGGMSMTFANVGFSYPNRKKHNVLADLNIHIPADTLCAFTGPSGAGKSTLFSLILDHYTLTTGQILLDGRSLHSLPETYRDEIAIVPQESVLFNASVEFNITIGLPPGNEASRSDIEEVCKLANIHNVIAKLPEGYDTIVGGTGGGLLSGGQKQRIALARALIRKPRLLLLDEATSALDNESERIWKDSLDSLMARQHRGGGLSWGRMTVVAIAHRLSTVRRAARIFWIEGGICQFSGTHEELYRRCEGYRNAVDGQDFSVE
jgi:ATP-binding cassette, subfamily B (MDR/TAP), member 1